MNSIKNTAEREYLVYKIQSLYKDLEKIKRAKFYHVWKLVHPKIAKKLEIVTKQKKYFSHKEKQELENLFYYIISTPEYKLWQYINGIKKGFTYLISNYYFILPFILAYMKEKGYKRQYYSLFTQRIKINKINLQKKQRSTFLKKVDIIIPWYGDENIFPLISNIFKTDDDYINQVIIINDGFPSQKMNSDLQAYIKQRGNKKIRYLMNNINKGFTFTANKGMEIAHNDIILLNSDVILTDKWISKLMHISQSSELIATVTPMSNNAMIFSLPNSMKKNKDSNPEETNSLLEKITPIISTEVPTAHGFCMYIKKKYLEKYGYFDEKTFKKGYGEENDLSLRFKKEGLINVAACNTYIYHLESKSFGHSQRKKYIKEHYSHILSRYPFYEKDLNDFMNKYPFSDMRQLLQFFRKKKEVLTKNTVLIIIHTNPFTIIGGVQKETEKIINDIKNVKNNAYNILVYYFREDTQNYELLLMQNGKIMQIFDFAAPVNCMNILKWIIQVFSISLCLVEHMMYHSWDYGKIFAYKNIPVITFVHDYYFFSQMPDLLDRKGNLLDFDADIDQYNKAAHELYGTDSSHEKKWREQGKLFFEKYSSRVIFNSEYTKGIYSHLLSLDKDNIKYSVSYPDFSCN